MRKYLLRTPPLVPHERAVVYGDMLCAFHHNSAATVNKGKRPGGIRIEHNASARSNQPARRSNAKKVQKMLNEQMEPPRGAMHGAKKVEAVESFVVVGAKAKSET